jgi:hypothetical protein
MSDEETRVETEEQPKPAGRTSRRTFIQGTAAASAAVAATYVKPELASFGVPSALAQSAGGPPQGEFECEIDIRGFQVTLNVDTNVMAAMYDVLNIASPTHGCQACVVERVDVYVQRELDLGGAPCGSNLGAGLVAHIDVNSGGSNPLVVGQIVPASCEPNVALPGKTALVAGVELLAGVIYRMTLIVDVAPPIGTPPGPWSACASALIFA